MSFLYPAFLFGALAVAVPIVLHLLRRDVAPEVPFTAVRLLKISPVERSRRTRLRDLLLLAARVAAVLLLAAAFARPFAPGAAAAMAPLRIVAVDRSFSMAAPGRFERVLERARAAVDEAAFAERVAVIAFDDRAAVIAEPGAAADARSSLSTLRAGSGGTRYSAVLSRAAEMANGGEARLIVITDLQRAGWEGDSRARIPATMQVETRDTGAPPANLGVVDARLDDRRVTAAIRNASAAPASGTVTLMHQGREVARAGYAAAPATTVEVSLPWQPSSGGVVLSIADDKGYPADNARYLVIHATEIPAVMIVSSPDSPGFYLQRALAADESRDPGGFRTRLVSTAEIAGGRAEMIAKHRALVLLSTRNLDRAAREAIAGFVRTGGGLLIAAAPDVEPSVVASLFGWSTAGFVPAEARQASLTATDSRHPILRPFGAFAANLGNVRFERAWKVDGTGWHVAARFDDGSPALLERGEGQGRVVLFASDLDRRWNDFPVHPTFVPFVTEAVRHVAARAVSPDQFVVGRVPAGIPGEPGVHQLEGGRAIAVNVDPRESSTSLMTSQEFSDMLEPVAVTMARSAREEQTESRQSLWQYGLLMMLGVLIVESFVGRA
ncbi:MAG: BatA domain-containing protein [Acidobacteria bacterium]|nr:BatA domain-containing protein [Acidobacteriota bacterium]